MNKIKLPEEYEKRNINVDVKIRSEDVEGNKKRYLAGFIPYNVRSEHLPEIIMPSAFKKSLQERNILCLFNHSAGQVLGSSKNGTLRLNNTTEGLEFEVEVPNTTWGNDCYEIVSRGDISGVSFGFSPVKTEYRNNVEELQEVKLFEVSFVSMPAYEKSVGVALKRNINLIQKRGIEMEQFLELIAKPVTDLTEEEKTLIVEKLNELNKIYVEKEVEETDSEADKAAEATAAEEAQKALELKKLVELESSTL